MDDHKLVVILTWPCSLTRSVTFSFTFLYISGINASEKYLSDGKLYHGSIEFIRCLKSTRWTMLNGSLSTAIISPRRRWICRALGWLIAYGFPLSNTWKIVGCFLLPLALVCDYSFSTFWRAVYTLGCFVITCLRRLLVLYDFVLLPPLETLSSQTLQQALLSSVAFTYLIPCHSAGIGTNTDTDPSIGRTLLKIPRLIAYVFTHTQCSNRWRSHVPNLRGAPGGQNRDIHLMFLGPRLQCSYQVSPRDITTEVYVTMTKPRCARQ